MKVDLRVARIVAADEVPEARKLVRLTLSLGGDQQRNVFAGIKSAYRTGRTARSPRRHGRQPRTAPNEIRPQRRHGDRLRPRWRPDLPAVTRFRCRARTAYPLTTRKKNGIYRQQIQRKVSQKPKMPRKIYLSHLNQIDDAIVDRVFSSAFAHFFSHDRICERTVSKLKKGCVTTSILIA